MSNSNINQLNIYMSARQLEDAVVKLANKLPEDESFPLADDLRRAATAVSHYIYASHHFYSYSMKMEALHQARAEAEKAQRLLAQCQEKGFVKDDQLAQDYLVVIKQSWGLVKYFKTKQAERRDGAETNTQTQPATA